LPGKQGGIAVRGPHRGGEEVGHIFIWGYGLN
jgi:hypothetical protein